ncbi:LysR family transcriptional regulator [Arthrobacter sp. 35W]|uniref:LysR family transcriptional regulator n=1 Tax=Arthrobacter sp. 35W TaxID=1132441 RepID=UPI0003FC6B9B|nr:LysR family transcriptional regulator [Arthrobacter sp. 35W]
MSVTLRQLEVLVGVVEQGGFGAAADHLQMSQSAVSHALASLEQVTGAPLVQRAPVIAPTPLGDTVLTHARSVLASVRSLEAAVDQHHDRAATGTVRLGAGVTVSHRLVPDLLRRWRAELPGLDIRLFEGGDDELEVWLATGAIDAAVLVADVPVQAGAAVLAHDDFRAVLRADHPLAGVDRISLHDLLEDPLLASTAGCEPQIRAIHDMADAPYAPAQRVHETSTLLGMVEAGLGVAIMPSLAQTMLNEDLVMVQLDPCLKRTLVLTGPSARPWHPGVARMCHIAEHSGAEG